VEQTETSIIGVANRMLERFGDDAVREVELRIAELKDHGEMETAAFWQQVHDALLELLKGGPGQTKQ
jgi:hypothetical protein